MNKPAVSSIQCQFFPVMSGPRDVVKKVIPGPFLLYVMYLHDWEQAGNAIVQDGM